MLNSNMPNYDTRHDFLPKFYAVMYDIMPQMSEEQAEAWSALLTEAGNEYIGPAFLDDWKQYAPPESKYYRDVTSDLRRALADAHSYGWDGCHKIYIAMDAGTTRRMQDSGYDMQLVDGAAFDVILAWYQMACGLKFISAVTDAGDNSGYEDIVPQGWEWLR